MLFGEVELAKSAMVDSLRINQPYTKRHETLQLHDGESSLIDYSVTPIQFGDTNSLIIEMQRIDRFLRINREEALSSVQDSSRNLIKGLAHEIKNPLGGIRGAAQLLRQELIDGLAGSETQEFCNIIVTEVDRLRNHIAVSTHHAHHRRDGVLGQPVARRVARDADGWLIPRVRSYQAMGTVTSVKSRKTPSGRDFRRH